MIQPHRLVGWVERSEAHLLRRLRWVSRCSTHPTATALAERRDPPRLALTIAGCGFAVGMLLFAFSLFALALTGIAAFAVVTPFGGAALLIGWAALGCAAGRPR